MRTATYADHDGFVIATLDTLTEAQAARLADTWRGTGPGRCGPASARTLTIADVLDMVDEIMSGEG